MTREAPLPCSNLSSLFSSREATYSRSLPLAKLERNSVLNQERRLQQAIGFKHLSSGWAIEVRKRDEVRNMNVSKLNHKKKNICIHVRLVSAVQ